MVVFGGAQICMKLFFCRSSRLSPPKRSSTPSWFAVVAAGVVWSVLQTVVGVVGGVTDIVEGSAEGRGLRSWRALLLLGIVLGGLAYTLLAGAPDAGTAYSWLDAHGSFGAEETLSVCIRRDRLSLEMPEFGRFTVSYKSDSPLHSTS